jgi:division/cell wall cluster transcriptional repressor MraZ
LALDVKNIQKNSLADIQGGVVSGTFLGQFENSITNRRVSIPQTLRDQFSPASKNRIVAVRGRLNTIYLFPFDNWKELEHRLEQGNRDEKDLLQAFRLYAAILTIEGPGRILLPRNLVEMAGITDKVVFLGEGKYFSLWNRENFKKYLAEADKKYDEILHQYDHLL